MLLSVAGALLLSIALAATLAGAPEVSLPGAEPAGGGARSELSFIPNRGQLDSARARYYAQGAGYGVYFTQDHIAIARERGDRGHALHLRFVGANENTRLIAARPREGKVNYLKVGGSQANLPTYGALTYENLWPGIDMAIRGSGGRLKYEFHVAPGADPSDIRLRYDGASSLRLRESGVLAAGTPLGPVTDARPRSHQTTTGRVAVESAFMLHGERSYGFALGSYDHSRPLVIDPAIVYATYLGGTNTENVSAVAVDASGSAYVAGDTRSADYPTTPGSYDVSVAGQDVTVTKVSPDGSSILYSTYIGSFSQDWARGITVDGSGSAVITGRTATGFPTTPGAFDTTYSGGAEGFVTKLSPDGSSLLFSTYIGGSGEEESNALAMDPLGDIYITGLTTSADFPTTPGAYRSSSNGTFDAFVTKLDGSGSALDWSTYLGGAPGGEIGRGVAVDAGGHAYVTGDAGQAFPVTPGAIDHTDVGGAFVTKFSVDGSGLAYSGRLRGATSTGIAVDAAGQALVGGSGYSGFPTTPGAFDTTPNGNFDGVLAHVNAAGSGLRYGTYLGGSSGDSVLGVALDSSGRAYAVGLTESSNFPTTPGAPDRFTSNDAFLTRMKADGSALDYSTGFGGSGNDEAYAIAVHSNLDPYVAGITDSTDLATAGAYDTTISTAPDGFVAKLGVPENAGSPARASLFPDTDSSPAGEEQCFTASVFDDPSPTRGLPVAGATVRLSVTGANTASDVAVTGTNGQATLCYTGTHGGQDDVVAFADNDGDGEHDPSEPFDTATNTVGPGTPAAIDAFPETATTSIGFSHCITIRVDDAYGNAAPSASIFIRVAGANTTSEASVTGGNGLAEYCYFGTNAGEDTISAEIVQQQNPRPTDTVTNTWVTEAHLTLTPETDSNPLFSQHCVTATVADHNFNPVPGLTVRFSVSGANTRSGIGTSDQNGQVPFCYLGTRAGQDSIFAFVDSNGSDSYEWPEASDTAQKTWTGYPRPGGATPLRVPLVPEYRQCTSPNSEHVAPLDEPSCTPPILGSNVLTTSSVGRGQASARLDVKPGDLGTSEDEADVAVTARASDVRCAVVATGCAATGADYAGRMLLRTALRITDNSNGPSGTDAATLSDTALEAPFNCLPTVDPNRGSDCTLSTSVDALIPGLAVEGRRAVISAFGLTLNDAGPNGSGYDAGCPPTCGDGDESVYLRQGVFFGL